MVGYIYLDTGVFWVDFYHNDSAWINFFIMAWWAIFSQTQGYFGSIFIIMAVVGNFNFSYFLRLMWESLGLESECGGSVCWPNNKIIDKRQILTVYVQKKLIHGSCIFLLLSSVYLFTQHSRRQLSAQHAKPLPKEERWNTQRYAKATANLVELNRPLSVQSVFEKNSSNDRDSR